MQRKWRKSKSSSITNKSHVSEVEENTMEGTQPSRIRGDEFSRNTAPISTSNDGNFGFSRNPIIGEMGIGTNRAPIARTLWSFDPGSHGRNGRERMEKRGKKMGASGGEK